MPESSAMRQLRVPGIRVNVLRNLFEMVAVYETLSRLNLRFAERLCNHMLFPLAKTERSDLIIAFF